MLRFDIDANGKATVNVVQSAGDSKAHKMLDLFAKQSLLTCSISPARDGAGKAVPSVELIEYRWRLR